MKPARIHTRLFACAAALLLATTAAATIPGLTWSLESGTSISGSTLVADLPTDGVGRRAIAMAKVDISHCLGTDTGARFNFRVRGVNVQQAADTHNGAKAMLVYKDASGTTQYPQFDLPTGTFDWTNGSVRINFLRGSLPADGSVTIALGLQDSGGRVEFDLSALALATETLGIERVNGDYIVRYPTHDLTPQSGDLTDPWADLTPDRRLDASMRRMPLRGVMSPAPATTESDIATLASWGATLLRFQICRNFSAVSGRRRVTSGFPPPAAGTPPPPSPAVSPFPVPPTSPRSSAPSPSRPKKRRSKQQGAEGRPT